MARQFELNAETALQILQSRGKQGLIVKPGKYTAKVTSVNAITRENGDQATIINFNRATQYQMQQVSLPAYHEEDFEAAVGKGTSLSTSVLEGQFVPQKGEQVNIMVDKHVNKDGINILVVSGVYEIAVTELSAFDVEKALAKLEAGEGEEATATATAKLEESAI